MPEMQIIKEGWHIVLCEPNRELTAVSGMTDRGFIAMCPADYIRRRTGRRGADGRPAMSKEASPKAMIPGYAFVRSGLSTSDMEIVKRTPGVIRFFITGPKTALRFAALTDAQVDDLRALDAMNFERFQESVRPKSERQPAVPFEAGKEVKVFCSQLGRDIYGQMVEKRGDGQIKIDAGHISILVPHVDVMEMEKAS